MQVKVFECDKNGKISFTKSELEKLLNEVYNGGYRDGEKKWWTWTSPSITTPYYSTTINGTTTNPYTITGSSTSGVVTLNKTVGDNFNA